MSDEELLKESAVEYSLRINGLNVRITRWDNHRRFIREGWVVVYRNEFYLMCHDGKATWEYKRFSAFKTAEIALSWLKAYPPTKIL